MISKFIVLLTLLTLISCNAALTGGIVDQSENNDNLSEQISDVQITKSNNEYILDIQYVDYDNNFRSEKSVVSLYNSVDLRGLKKSFTSVGYAYSGDVHCLNMQCTNADFDIKFDRDNETSKSLKIAKREYSIKSSSIRFFPNDYQSKGDVLFEAKEVQSKLNSSLMMSMIQIEGVKVPLFKIHSIKKLDKNKSAIFNMKSNGVNSSITIGAAEVSSNELRASSSSLGGDFKIVSYKNDVSGAIALHLKNYNGSVVIDTYR